MIKNYKKFCPNSIQSLYSRAKFWFRFTFNPKGLASEMFRGILGYDIDWDNPKDLNEKINWMKFNTDTTIWTRLADKYLVRDYVKERISEDVLPKLYGVWKHAEDIDFDKLPSKFVLKTNHGSGTIILVDDKSKINALEIRKKLNYWLSQKYGYHTIEPHYMKIKPVIIAEEFLENDSSFSSSILDYKVFCFNGKPYCIEVCRNRIIGGHYILCYYDCEWNLKADMAIGYHKGENINIPRPTSLPTLLDYACKLSAGHPQVRVDFYIVNDKVYFGEMTFTSQGGYMDWFSRDYSLEMGALVDLPNKG